MEIRIPTQQLLFRRRQVKLSRGGLLAQLGRTFGAIPPPARRMGLGKALGLGTLGVAGLGGAAYGGAHATGYGNEADAVLREGADGLQRGLASLQRPDAPSNGGSVRRFTPGPIHGPEPPPNGGNDASADPIYGPPEPPSPPRRGVASPPRQVYTPPAKDFTGMALDDIHNWVETSGTPAIEDLARRGEEYRRNSGTGGRVLEEAASVGPNLFNRGMGYLQR
jgi:hypothetical protein